MSKSIFTSKTFWLNVVGIGLAIANVLPAKYSMPALGILNIANRFFTSDPVHLLN